MLTQKTIEKMIAICMLMFAIWFNFSLYRQEPTAKVDPNDNAFQFALVDRTNQIWDFAVKNCKQNILLFPVCHFSYLADHWVPNWAEGYNLPFYYSHIPQISIVATFRFISLFTHSVTLFQYYHWLIYVLMCLFPLSVFWAIRVLKLPWITSGIGALLALQISTDGLYGLDPSSFLWRGYGLSSQLFAMIFFPVATAFAYRFIAGAAPTLSMTKGEKPGTETPVRRQFVKLFSTSDFWPAVLFLCLTTAGHLGLGIMAFMTIGALAISFPLLEILKLHTKRDVYSSLIGHFKRFFILSAVALFFVSYWVIPVLLYDNYHNISFWDPVWKFDSYGAKEVITRLFNGDLFDFGRFPVITFLTLLGAFSLLLQSSDLAPLALLFIFWLVMYFGRTSWGGLVDLIPGMKEFHLSRFIVGLHLAGFFLAPIGFWWLCKQISSTVNSLSSRHLGKRLPPLNVFALEIMTYLFVALVLIVPVYRQTIKYNALNDTLILQANRNFDKVHEDSDALFQTLRSLPSGRVFTGRGGWWGKDFKVAETPYYMHLSTYGIPTVLWLPETWSPNSDTEQYFSETKASDYDLYNMSYVAAPPSQKPELFWKFVKKSPTWSFYTVATSGYFTPGTRAAIVSTDKRSYVNVVHSWIQSDFPGKKLFPQLTFDKNFPKPTGLPNFKMIDEITYRIPDGSVHNLMAQPPVYMGPSPDMTIGAQTNDTDMTFKAKVTVGKDCVHCVVILKQSSNPQWQVTIDGKKAQTLTVFPFFVATELNQPGTHEVVFAYRPDHLKVALITIELTTVVLLVSGYVFLAYSTKKKV